MVTVEFLDKLADEFGMTKMYAIADGTKRLASISIVSPYFPPNILTNRNESVLISLEVPGQLTPDTWVNDYLAAGFHDYGDWMEHHMYDGSDPADFYDSIDLIYYPEKSAKLGDFDEEGVSKLFRTICEKVAISEEKIRKRSITKSGQILKTELETVGANLP